LLFFHFILALLGEQNPELLRLINAHQQEFLAMMNEPVDGEDYEDDHQHEGDEQFECTCFDSTCIELF
jgi:hypothetical protein